MEGKEHHKATRHGASAPHESKSVQENFLDDTGEITITVNKKKLGKIFAIILIVLLFALFIAAYIGKLPGQGGADDESTNEDKAKAADDDSTKATEEETEEEEKSLISSLLSYLVPSRNDDVLNETERKISDDKSDAAGSSSADSNVTDSNNADDETDDGADSENEPVSDGSGDNQTAVEGAEDDGLGSTELSDNETPLDELDSSKIGLEIIQIYTKIKGDDFGAVTKVDFKVSNKGAQTFEPRIIFYLYGTSDDQLYSRSRFTFDSVQLSEGDELEMSIRMNANSNDIDKEKKVVLELTDKLGNVLKSTSKKVMLQ